MVLPPLLALGLDLGRSRCAVSRRRQVMLMQFIIDGKAIHVSAKLSKSLFQLLFIQSVGAQARPAQDAVPAPGKPKTICPHTAVSAWDGAMHDCPLHSVSSWSCGHPHYEGGPGKFRRDPHGFHVSLSGNGQGSLYLRRASRLPYSAYWRHAKGHVQSLIADG